MCLPRSVKFLCACSDTHWFIGWQGSGCKESALEWLHCKTSPPPYIQPLCQRSTITLRVTRKNDVSGLDQTCLTRQVLWLISSKNHLQWFSCPVFSSGDKKPMVTSSTLRWRYEGLGLHPPPKLIEASFSPPKPIDTCPCFQKVKFFRMWIFSFPLTDLTN